MKAPNGKHVVLLFWTAAPVAKTARLHVEDCPTVKRASRAVTIDRNVDEITIIDLNERGFTVFACKCCGGTTAERLRLAGHTP